MGLFFKLLLEILPLYFLILLGFIAGKYLKAQKETIARILIFIITPIVIFSSVSNTNLSINVILLPVLFFGISSAICILTYLVASKIWTDATKNLLAFASGTANAGYFGLPVGIVLFGADIAGLVVISMLGFTIFENSLGFFITARGKHSVKESFRRVLRLPSIYAFFAGLIVNFMGIKLGQNYLDFAELFRGGYSILGMMLIGMGLSTIVNYDFDYKFITSTVLLRFVIWPLIISFVIFFDTAFVHFFNQQIYKVMVLMGMVPLAANTVAYATELKVHPEKASIAVLLSTIIALFYIPFTVTFFL